MPRLRKQTVLLAKIEAAYNTDPSPVEGTDAMLVEEPSWSFVNQRMIEQPAVKNTLGTRPHIYGATLAQVTCTVTLRGSGAAGTAPEYGPLLKACGMSETVNAGTSVVYTPSSPTPPSGDHDSVTIYLYMAGKLHQFTGCRGTWELNATAGEPARITFTLTGHYAGDSDTALASPTYQDVLAPQVVSGAFTMGGDSVVINDLGLNIGNTVDVPPSVNASDGYSEIIVTGRDVTGSFNPEEVSKATKDFISEWQSGTSQAMNIGPIGSANNQWQITAPAIYYRDIAPGERNGLNIYDIGFGAAEDSGDDEITLTFT